MSISKPDPGEFSSYVAPYINRMPDDGALLQNFKEDYTKLKTLLESLSDDQLNERYAKGKWTIKEVLVHLIDSERIFDVRILRIARGDQTDLPGFDQEDYVDSLATNGRSAESIFAEFDDVRASTLSLLASLGPKQFKHTGFADGAPVSVRALAYMMAGHQRHHINTIEERYL